MISQKKIAFLIGKSSEIKFLSPIIIESLKRKIKTILICGPKPYSLFPKSKEQRPLRENIKFPNSSKVEFIYYENSKELLNIIKNKNVPDIITSKFWDDTFDLNIIKISKIHYIQSTGDFLYIKPDTINNFENLFFYTNSMINLYKKSYPEINNSNIKKIKIVGNPVYDTLNKLKPESIIEKYNIPKNKKIVLLFSANTEINFWKKYVFGLNSQFKSALRCLYNGKLLYLKDIIQNQNYKKIVRSIKEWCDENNAILIVKSKLKHKEPSFIKEAADIFIKDNLHWYPYKTPELCMISNLSISFNYSTSCLDSIVGKTPNIQIVIKEPFFKYPDSSIPFINSKIYHNKNVNLIKDHRKFIKYLKNKKIENFKIDSEDRLDTIKNFVGIDSIPASKKIIDEILKNS